MHGTQHRRTPTQQQMGRGERVFLTARSRLLGALWGAQGSRRVATSAASQLRWDQQASSNEDRSDQGRDGHARDGHAARDDDRRSPAARSDDRRMPAARTIHQPSRQKEEVSGRRHEFFATCHPGLEGVVADELRALGITEVEPGKAGVTFRWV